MQEESGDRNGYHKQLFAQETERLVELGIDRTARYSEAGGEGLRLCAISMTSLS